MSIADQRQGTVFAGRYRLERKLGSGGMADVWLAEDQELGRKVAVKILHERYANDAQFVERFRREATHAASLSHPNIVSIFDRGEAGGSYYIVMEYVEGRTLKELIVTRGACPIPVAISYVRQVLAGLRFAHRAGIVHRDVKPHNVIVDSEGHVKVMDFGIARAGTSEMTEVGSIIGTAQYLSPEQARGAPVDESSDLYSTGVLLYELMTGRVPFTGETPVEVAMKHLSQVPDAPSTIRPEIPRDLDLIVLRSLAKEPTERYRTAQEMDRDLERVARGEAVDRETETAATMVMRGETTAVTTVGPRAPDSSYAGPERYRAYDTEVRKSRNWWPWLIALALAIAVGIGGFILYDSVQSRLDANRTFAVDNYVGLLESRATALIRDAEFDPNIQRIPSTEVEKGYVIEQDPSPGTKLPKGSKVTLRVSTGKPEVNVPPLVGKNRDDAVKELTALGLDSVVVEVNSSQAPGTVTATDPTSGTVVLSGTKVRINVSKGVKQVAVPSVVGQQVDVASAQLQTAGFNVGRVDVESDRPAGEVVAQNPAGNSTAAKGSSVTLSVSKGPKTIEVPDVTLQPIADARTALKALGFKVSVIREDTSDPTLDGVVLRQDPSGLAQADPGSVIALTVGLFVEPPPDTTGTDTTGTETAPVNP
ncbi:MAG: Stk1 family PASTA domain-containing Ser/Thr kinase [Gaiellales bacterium]